MLGSTDAPHDDSSSDSLSSAEFAEQFSAAYPRLWGLASALLGDRTEAEDLVQQAALVALEKLGDFTPGSNFNAWMSRIVRMHALNWRRKKAARKTAAADPVEMDQSQAGAEELPISHDKAEDALSESARGSIQVIEKHFDDELRRSLQGLEEVPRACLLLRVVHDLTYEEIAQLLEIPAGTAMSHVYRCKRRLRRDLPAEGSDPNPCEPPLPTTSPNSG